MGVPCFLTPYLSASGKANESCSSGAGVEISGKSILRSLKQSFIWLIKLSTEKCSVLSIPILKPYIWAVWSWRPGAQSSPWIPYWSPWLACRFFGRTAHTCRKTNLTNPSSGLWHGPFQNAPWVGLSWHLCFSITHTHCFWAHYRNKPSFTSWWFSSCWTRSIVKIRFNWWKSQKTQQHHKCVNTERKSRTQIKGRWKGISHGEPELLSIKINCKFISFY